MHGFCVECGKPLANPKFCPDRHPQQPLLGSRTPSHSGKPQSIGPLPKASTSRRLLGSGVEYGVYLVTLAGLSIVSFVTAGIFDVIPAAILFLMLAIRDANAGLFSLAKRIGKMRVVEYGTGKPASNGQALLRNSYYLVLIFLTAFPVIFTDMAASALFVFLVFIDVALIMITKEGRRIGDVIARTQVVHEAKRT